MLTRIKQILRTDLVRVTSWSAIATVTKMLTGIVSIKVVAQLLGPPGIAVIGQFLNLATILSNISSGGIGQGITKYVAESAGDAPLQRVYIRNATLITLVSTAIVSLLTIIFAGTINDQLFSPAHFETEIRLLGSGIIAFSVNALLLSIVNGLKQFKKFVVINIIISILSLIVSVGLVFWKGLAGALWAVIISQVVSSLFAVWVLRKEGWISALFQFREAQKPILKKLLSFTAMAMVSAILVPSIQLFIRSYVQEEISVDAAGIWEGMNRLSAMFLLVITTSLATYYLPRLSELKNNFDLKVEIFKTAKLVLPVVLFSCVVIYFLRELVITLFFAPNFLPMKDLFAFQMLGNFFKVTTFLMGYLFWAKGMTVAYIVSEFAFTAIYLGLTAIFVNAFGLVGTAHAYAANYILFTGVLVIKFRSILFLSKKEIK